MPGRLLFVYNWVPERERQGVYAECTSTKTMEQLLEALQASGNEVVPCNAASEDQITAEITKQGPFDLAFITAEGYLREPASLFDGTGAAQLRSLFRELGIPASHSAVEGMENCRQKNQTYACLSQWGVPVPWNKVIHPGENLLLEIDSYPVFVKPAGGGNSLGIDQQSVVQNPVELENRLAKLWADLGNASLLVEEYLSGREFTVGVVGNREKIVLPPLGFPHDYGVRTGESKRTEAGRRNLMELINSDDSRYLRLHQLACKTFEAVGANDVIRIDFKERTSGELCVIDVNGTPSLSLSGSLAYMAQHLGLTLTHLVNLILYQCMQRHGLQITCEMEAILAEPRLKLLNYVSVVA